MRHKVAGKHLGRDADHRRLLRRNLMNALFRHERIKTTEAKAAAIRGEAEKLITLAKRSVSGTAQTSGVHHRRIAFARLRDKENVAKLFDVFAARYEDRPGGYTRVYKLGPRKGDRAPMVLLELVDREED